MDDMDKLAASRFRDWHLDILDRASSVLFELVTVPGVNGAPSQQTTKPRRIPEELLGLADKICDELELLNEAKRVAFDVAGLRFRGERIRKGRYALRLIPEKFLEMKDLSHNKQIEDLLKDPQFSNGGLVLIGGDLGTGKTATAAATVVARLQAYGGYCLEVSSPIENMIEGFHGEGYVEQVDATENGYKYEVESAMRKFPAETRNMFFFGEILEEQAAAEVVRLAGRGQLVITTIAGRNPTEMIKLLVTFAERGGETRARELLGANLRAVVHQKLVNHKPVATGVKVDEAMRNLISGSEPLTQLTAAIDQIDRASKQLNRPAGAGQPRMTM
ncbi:ATPase, T2SS/T4P/T4SS family [Herbaspirillum seropedicae]|uniref:ATPase, T2SS/T4P/T4SS family n=1 Tax=Herbaspirillum seropedicae TaxID=964 RepID=UPI00285C0E4F|nr:ATPase, T2SS/T4P/T4SS family [Herbaspirillum seropedicae]MDR6398066.1 Tfp pilus assembly pilus retraction ATPase PilT [Herbaspirillum seropedicae]